MTEQLRSSAVCLSHSNCTKMERLTDASCCLESFYPQLEIAYFAKYSCNQTFIFRVDLEDMPEAQVQECLPYLTTMCNTRTIFKQPKTGIPLIRTDTKFLRILRITQLSTLLSCKDSPSVKHICITRNSSVGGATPSMRNWCMMNAFLSIFEADIARSLGLFSMSGNLFLNHTLSFLASLQYTYRNALFKCYADLQVPIIPRVRSHEPRLVFVCSDDNFSRQFRDFMHTSPDMASIRWTIYTPNEVYDAEFACLTTLEEQSYSDETEPIIFLFEHIEKTPTHNDGLSLCKLTRNMLPTALCLIFCEAIATDNPYLFSTAQTEHIRVLHKSTLQAVLPTIYYQAVF
jgi:hypothetical protein